MAKITSFIWVTQLALKIETFLFQRSFFCRLTEDKKSEKFFRVFYDRMKLAQLEIKATVTVNTSDLGNRKREDDNQDKDGPVRKKGQRSSAAISSKAGCILN